MIILPRFILSPVLKALFLSVALVVLSACSDSENTSTDRDESASASYKVTFTTTWTVTDFPTKFPGGAHFSGLIGATHNNQIKFWEAGQLATAGIESMAETGATNGVSAEVSAAKVDGKAEFVLAGSGNSAAGTVELDFDINETYPLVTLVSMVAPSPDWFVGVHGLSLYDDAASDWKDKITVSLNVYDAGTDSGLSFQSGNEDSQPADPILLLSSEPADTDFVGGAGANGKFIASMIFERVK